MHLRNFRVIICGALSVTSSKQYGMAHCFNIHPEKKERLLEILYTLLDKSTSEFSQYLCFFELIDMLNRSQKMNITDSKKLSPDLIYALQYFDKNYKDKIVITELAAAAHVSLNTIERHFLNSFGMSPNEFLKKRRLSYATKMLRDGMSVSDACFQNGFADYCAFIAYFRKKIGITPLQYKKRNTQ